MEIKLMAEEWLCSNYTPLSQWVMAPKRASGRIVGSKVTHLKTLHLTVLSWLGARIKQWQ
jgi:hypothetical protein